jgi:hypothetical protein
MREISSDELLAVSGAYMEVDDNRRASLAIGTNIGNFVHGMNSWESRVGGLFGPVGALVGGYIHFARVH